MEDRIEEANAVYRARGLALIQKIPTPVGIIKLLPGGKLTGFWQRPSTVDFIGFAADFGVAVESKKTTRKAFPLDQIHAHQRRFLTEVEVYGHLALFLVEFSAAHRTFTVPWGRVHKAIEAGTASLPVAWFEAHAREARWDPRLLCLHYLEPYL